MNVNIFTIKDIDREVVLFSTRFGHMDIFELMPKDHFGVVGEKIRNNLDNGESALVYGIYGSGVQYLMRYFEHELKTKTSNVLFFRGSLIQSDAINIITHTINKLTKTKSLEHGLNSFTQNNKLYLLVDSFHRIKNLSQTLKFLGDIRKTNPHSIVNIIGIDHSFLGNNRKLFLEEDSAFSSIYELGLFDLEGTKRVIEINNKFYEWQVPTNLCERIYSLSGGNPRLIKYISKIIMEEGFEVLDNIDFLINHNLLEPKLNKFIELLFQFDASQMRKLSILNSKGELFSELLRYKVENYELPYITELLPELSAKERKIFSYLLSNKNKIISTDKLDFILGLTGESYSLWASYKALNRLRKKIKHKFVLKNVKGQGYLLEELNLS